MSDGALAWFCGFMTLFVVVFTQTLWQNYPAALFWGLIMVLYWSTLFLPTRR